MKISELIRKLRVVQAAEGDIEVRCWAKNPESWLPKPVEYLNLTRDGDYGPVEYVTVEDEMGEPWESLRARNEAGRVGSD